MLPTVSWPLEGCCEQVGVQRGPHTVAGNAFFNSHRDGDLSKLMPLNFATVQEGSENKCLPNENHFHLQHGFAVMNSQVNYIFV